MRRFGFHKKEEEVRPAALVNLIKKEPKDIALEKTSKAGAKRPHAKALPKGLAWGIAGLVVLFIVGFFISFYVVRGRVADSVAKSAATLQAGVEDLQNFDPKSAAEKFATFKDTTPSSFESLFATFNSFFKGGREAITSFADLANQLTLFSIELDDISRSSFDFLTSGDGAKFIADLKRLRDTMGILNDASGKLSSIAALAGDNAPLGGSDNYLPLIAELQGAKSFLDILIPWLSRDGEHHVLALLQNPSEMRPAGGFLGSYADVTIASGSVKNIDVRDIADVDVAFTPKIVPPKPLQVIVSRWRPADANWFFDFPTSASKTVAFFEESNLYKKSSTTFDAAIAISPKIVSDLLALTGPITVGKPAKTFTSSNFLIEIQKIVQDGQATDATYPKQVLRDLSEAIFAKLEARPVAAEKALLGKMLDWGDGKDVVAYFKDPAMQQFAKRYGVAGDVYDLPQKFNGDYLSVVDANINGGKSDLYVSSTVSYVGQIGAEGTLTSHVIVTRKHNGNRSPYWWYKTTNQDYVQIFTSDGSSITNASGGITKKITPKVNYVREGYLTDPLVAALEATEQTLFAYPGVAWHKEAGKKVFTTWSAVKAGASTQFALDYESRLFIPPAEGITYQFVFEKQAGARRHYSIEIDAPLGYIFAENNIASFTYDTNDIPGRLIFNLTLKKI